MRLPPDVVALLIKVKDYMLIFGPALLVAISLKTMLLATIPALPISWQSFLKSYLEASSLRVNKVSFFSRFRAAAKVPVPAVKSSDLKAWLVETGALLASPTTLLAALVLSPLLLLVRLVTGGILGLISLLPLAGFKGKALPLESEAVVKRDHSSKIGSVPLQAEAISQEISPFPLKWFWQHWMNEVDNYLGGTLYNFLLAAIFTIFVPLQLVDGWIGPGQLAGPLLIPLLALVLAPVPGSETALVLALFIKGAGTGSGVAALLAFPLLSLAGLAAYQRRYGLKATIGFATLVWAASAGLGLLLDVLGVNANV